MKNITTLHPTYIDSFKCIGNECKNSCCDNWRISVDEQTYKKYKKSKHPLFKNKQLFEKNKSVVYIKLNEDKACPFLNKEQLCSIHSELGHHYLSRTCRIYPRNYNIIDGTAELSLLMSCEVAAENVLSNKDGIRFRYSNIKPVTDIYNNALSNQKDLIGRNFWPIRIFLIELLQFRELSFNERFAIMGIFIEKLKYAKNDNDITNIIQHHQSDIQKGYYTNFLDSLENKNQLISNQLRIITIIIKDLFEPIIKRKDDKLENYLLHNKFNTEEYIELYNLKFIPFNNQHEYIIENYIVNELFNLFPLFNSLTDLENKYIHLSLRVLLYKYSLTVYLGEYDETSVNDIYKLISKLSRFIDHNLQFNKSVLKFFELHKINSTPNIISITSF